MKSPHHHTTPGPEKRNGGPPGAKKNGDSSKKPLPQLFFDGRSGDYWLQTSGRFLRLSGRDVCLHYTHAGFEWEEFIGGMKAGHRVLVKAQIDRHVDYAGPLGGYRVGPFHAPGGKRVLVTSQADLTLPPAKRASWPFLEKFIFTLLGDEQTKWFLLWLKFARLSLEAGDLRPGQMAVFAGPSTCGKSFLQAIITEALGGRAADPFSFMVGETTFNGHLAGAEHWAMEESMGSTDIRSRNKFGARIKEFTVGGLLNVHTKGKDISVSVPTFRRLTLSVNDEQENLLIIPPLNASLADKVLLFKCRPAAQVLNEDRRENMAAVRRELGPFLDAVKKLPCPPKWASVRFGVAHFHHPELISALVSAEPHARLLELVDQVCFGKNNPTGQEWEGSADALEVKLRESPFSFAVDKLLYFSGACGTYLGRLKSKGHPRIASKLKHGKTTWKIAAPHTTEDTATPALL